MITIVSEVVDNSLRSGPVFGLTLIMELVSAKVLSLLRSINKLYNLIFRGVNAICLSIRNLLYMDGLTGYKKGCILILEGFSTWDRI